jgi:hypothetical protein
MMQALFFQVLDYSEAAITTASSTLEFKQTLIDKYSRLETSDAGITIRCMVTGQYLPTRFVIASHLWKRAWHRYVAGKSRRKAVDIADFLVCSGISSLLDCAQLDPQLPLTLVTF